LRHQVELEPENVPAPPVTLEPLWA
jgi:hypothetical protein